MRIRLLFLKVLVSAFSTLSLIFLVEWVLAHRGFPIEEPLPISYPPNYSELRKNIEFTYHFNTNSQGIRYREIPLKKRSKEDYRVVVLGDSFTEGVGVDASKTYSAILESNLSNPSKEIDFINCGLLGKGPLEYGRILYHVGFKYHPDQVLMMIYANDVFDTPILPDSEIESGEGWLFPRKINPKERNKAKNFIHALWPRTYISLVKSFKTLANLKPSNLVKVSIEEAKRRGIKEERIEQWESKLPPELVSAANRKEFNGYNLTRSLFNPNFCIDYLDLESENARDKYNSMIKIIDKTIQLCRERNIPVGIIYAPSPCQYDKNGFGITERLGGRVNKEWLKRETKLEVSLKLWAEKNELPYLNLTPTFKVANGIRPGKFHYKLDGHWTAMGNNLAATTILDWMKKNEMVPKTDRKNSEIAQVTTTRVFEQTP